MLNIIGSENYIDTSMYSMSTTVIPTTDQLVNTLTGKNEDDDNNQLMFILPMENNVNDNFNNNLILSQLKLTQMTDNDSSLFLSEQNNWVPFQVSYDASQNMSLVLPENETDLPENIPIETLKINNLFASPSSNLLETVPVPEPQVDDVLVFDHDQMNASKHIECDVCKVSFLSEAQLKLHDCINFVNVEQIINNQNDNQQKNMNIVLEVINDADKTQVSHKRFQKISL